MHDPITTHELSLARANLELARLNEIKAARTRDFKVHGVPTPASERAELDARIATAEAHKQAITVELLQAKAEWRAGRRTNQYAALTRLLSERGLGDVIQEAARLVDAGEHANCAAGCGSPLEAAPPASQAVSAHLGGPRATSA